MTLIRHLQDAVSGRINFCSHCHCSSLPTSRHTYYDLVVETSGARTRRGEDEKGPINPFSRPRNNLECFPRCVSGQANVAVLCDSKLPLRRLVIYKLPTQVRIPASDSDATVFCVCVCVLMLRKSTKSVLHELGFSDTKALLLACPPYILAGVASVSLAYSSGRFHERTWHITAAFTVAVVGFVAAASTLNQVGRYVACFIFPVGTYAVNSVIVAWVGTTLSQSPEKKAVGLTLFATLLLSIHFC